MTATAVAPKPATNAGYRLSFWGDVRSEWIKLRTLKSTWWVVGSTVVVMGLISLAFAAAIKTSINDPETIAQFGPSVNGIDVVTSGTSFAELVIAVLGVLVVSNEYASGMVRSTFTAVPARTPVVWAKALVLTCVTVVVGVVSVLVAYLAALPVLSGTVLEVDFSESETLRAVAGTVAVLALVAIMGLGIGVLLRHTAGAIFTAVALLFVLPIVGSLIPGQLVDDINPYLPSNAATSVMAVSDIFSSPDAVSPLAGLITLALWALVPLVAGAVILKIRDV